jgi:ferredoxin
MAYQIIADDCSACGACEFECPSNAISMKGDVYAISPDKCTECKDVHDSPQCASVCPVDACVPL